MEKFEYIITAVFSSNYDYTGYSSLSEVMEDFMSYVSREMQAKFSMKYFDNGHYFTASLARLEFAVNELDYLQECIDEFSNFSFADLYADVEIVQRNNLTGEIVPLLYVHIKGAK